MNRLKQLLIFVVFLFVSVTAHAQNRADFFDQPAAVVLPENYDPARSYPLIVFLPQVNASAQLLFERSGAELPKSEYIILLPAGTPLNNDYLPDFGLFVKWFEERLLKDIASNSRQYNIDTKRVILAGHSLGGDLGCALNARNPGRFAGFIVSGSRCGYSVNKAGLKALKKTAFRGAFYIGDQDQPARISGIKSAYNLFKKKGIESTFQLLTDHGHHEVPPGLFMGSLGWILGKE